MGKRIKKVKRIKRGLSEIISIIIVILLTIVAITIIWVVIKHNIENTKEKIEMLNILGLEQAKIEKATGNFAEGGMINITLQRTFSSIKNSTSQTTTSYQTIIEKEPVDIVLVLDRSGSMRQSGWVLETSLLPVNTTNLTVPRNAYSPIYSFYVPSGTQRLAVELYWSKVEGFNGSEGSELAMNLRRPSGTWIANSGNTPNDLGSKVDPPDSIGFANEYFSGISTKPQYYYIENPETGNWQVKVYGWNIRPSSSPPSSQNVSIKVYLGNSDLINKSNTVISSETVKSSSKSFIDRLDETDKSAMVRFGTYGELTQTLTSNKSLVKNAIDNIGSQGGTAINTGIDTATQHLTSSGDPNSMKAMIILTDGQNDVGQNPVIASAQQAKDKNFTIFTIGLTHFVDENLLRTVATKPDYYYYSDFDELDQVFRQLSEKISNIKIIESTGVSLIVMFLNQTSSCEKEIYSSQLPTLMVRKNFEFNLEGCITNITKIEIHPKINGNIGPALDTLTVKP
jgi:hypothetical protein